MFGCNLDLGVLLKPEESVQVAASPDNIFGTSGYEGDNYFFAMAYAPEYNLAILAERFNILPVDQIDQTREYLLVNRLLQQEIAELQRQPENFGLTSQDFQVTFNQKETSLPTMIQNNYQKILD